MRVYVWTEGRANRRFGDEIDDDEIDDDEIDRWLPLTVSPRDETAGSTPPSSATPRSAGRPRARPHGPYIPVPGRPTPPEARPLETQERHADDPRHRAACRAAPRFCGPHTIPADAE